MPVDTMVLLSSFNSIPFGHAAELWVLTCKTFFDSLTFSLPVFEWTRMLGKNDLFYVRRRVKRNGC
jgi:hypothetical protein